ncbi:anti-sigma factor [Herbiconiux sp. A18JL235]|uniref:Regulator of SigK n=1 Tax=Herbiconiux sp. A18JL235 TaxID=3152363 RepID=A0AB39BFG5_9MICO
MTGTRDDDDARLLSGAYSLDALSRAEADAFDSEATGSPALRDEADALRETSALLGLAVAPVQPSPRLKLDLMAKIAETPQESPVTPGAADAHGAPAVQDAPPASASKPDEDAVVTVAAPTEVTVAVAGPAELRARRRWFTGPVGIVVGAAAAAALFVGGLAGGALMNSGTGGAPVADSSATALAEITAAPDSQRASVPLDGGGAATLVWSGELGRSAVLVDGLGGLPDGKVYEAWYIAADGPKPAGTFTPSSSGTTWHVLDGAMHAGDSVGVTIEPAGGSATPTTDPVIVLPSA